MTEEIYAREIKIKLKEGCDYHKFSDDFVCVIEENNIYCFGILRDYTLDFTIVFGKPSLKYRKYLNIADWLTKHNDVSIYEFGEWFIVRE